MKLNIKNLQGGFVTLIFILAGILVAVFVAGYIVQKGVFTKNTVPSDNGLATSMPTSPIMTSPTLSTSTCNKTDYKMAFVLIAQNQSQVTPEKVNKLTAIKDAFAKDFSTATNALARMDTSYKVVTIVDDGTLIQNGYYLYDKVMEKFYEKNPDDFDFASIYPTFNDPNNGTQFHATVKNSIIGISTNHRDGVVDRTAQYGSKGRLLGINEMPNIDNIPLPIVGSGGISPRNRSSMVLWRG